VKLLLALSAALLACSRTSAAPVAQGEAIFKQRCAVCHLTTGKNAQGPGLGGVVNRQAASAPRFGYSRALRASGLTWDPATLDRFLAAPTRLVPGTNMVIALRDAAERGAVIAYLQTLRASPVEEAQAAAPESKAAPGPAASGLRTGKAALGDYTTDGPGVRRHLTLADLPAPFATASASNGPGVVAPPEGKKPIAPPGFTVEALIKDLENPRELRVAPNGDIFVAESAPGRIRVLRAKGAAIEKNEVFVKGLHQPFGIAFYPRENPQWVYIAESNAVFRYPYQSGDLAPRGARETVIGQLSGSSGGHWTRDLAFSLDGKRLYISVGSQSNVAERMPKRDPPKAGPLGAAWAEEERRADVLVSAPDGTGLQVFATGLRNCVGLAVHPATGDLWCSTNERDGMGDDLVPDYITRVKEGQFFGWPWYWLGDHEDPRLKGDRPDLKGKVTVPDVLVQAHSASLQMTFYDGESFPKEYRGDGFAAFHGSWNRARRTGYKVVRVPLHQGIPTGEYEDFLTGFVADADSVWGRPVGIAVARDGALLVSEDANGTIWRVSH
jgi:glucose/arabinose dehydrogenase/cytochrome c2